MPWYPLAHQRVTKNAIDVKLYGPYPVGYKELAHLGCNVPRCREATNRGMVEVQSGRSGSLLPCGNVAAGSILRKVLQRATTSDVHANKRMFQNSSVSRVVLQDGRRLVEFTALVTPPARCARMWRRQGVLPSKTSR
jgi:hypothetical protein